MNSNKNDPINLGLHIVHARHPSGKGGVTVAWRKPTDYGHMVDVAVSYCSKHDIFTKKIGTANAIEKFLKSEFIQVPVYGKSYWDIPEQLRAMFFSVPFHGQ